MIPYPPKPRFALTLGVTGHRYRRKDTAPGEADAHARPFDVPAVEAALRDLFQAVTTTFAAVKDEASDAFAAAAPEFTLVSSLAEGADRLAAHAAIEARFALDVVLPCPASIYVSGFDDDASRVEFDALMTQARACLVLPLAGKAEQPTEERLPRSYEAGGLTMLGQADILVAVWDGKPAEGRGGTGQIVNEAARRGMPILVVDPADGATRALWPDTFVSEAAARHAEDIAPQAVEACLAAILRRLIAPPSSPHEQTGLAEFFAAPISANPKAGARASVVFDGQNLGHSRTRWPRISAAVAASPSNMAAVRRYADALRAAEEVAGRSARRYRTLFLFSSAASAVASLLIGGAAHFQEMHLIAATFEFLTVALVGALVFFATLRSWHNQWFEAREGVERLRIVAIPWLLGAWPAGLRPGQSSWPGWYARAITREQPLFSGALADLLQEARDFLHALVEEQLSYHQRNAKRLERRDHFLEMIGLCLLVASIGDNAVYLTLRLTDTSGWRDFESWSLAASIFLPAAATACYGIRLFGDFEDLARRSRRTAIRLEAVKARLVGDLDLPALRTLAAEAAHAMLSDLEAWRIAVESRRLSAS